MKKKTKLKTLLALAALSVSVASPAQVKLVHNNKPLSRIVMTTPEKSDSIAATLLQDFVKRITNAELPIVSADKAGKKLSKGDVLIGNGLSNQQYQTHELKEDGYLLSTEDGHLRIVSGGDKGSVYGVVSLLERYCGVQYWGEKEYSLTPSKELELPSLRVVDNPAFRYRQSQFYGMATDPIYRLWMRLEEPREFFAGGYWVHTFNRLLPSSVYGEKHPEYYSYFDGKRHPGQASQWCLTNPEVFEIVAQRVDSIFKANPQCNIISISQNDGHTYCQCDKCRAINEREGSLSGTIITFLNKLAARFPDKEFSTLAYLFSVNPPKYVKPLPNVNIMLCDINCCREVPLTENVSGKEFMKALEGWSAMTNNIYVWDYGINFDNYVMPFPNFHILAENMRLFHQNHTQMHFSQIASNRGGDFAEMRSWMVSKLMWNPYLDADELVQTFLKGYYGDAAPYLYQYIKLMEGALLGSGHRLWIYDSPVSHKEGMLKPLLLKRYAELFDRAEAAVAKDSTLLARVQRSRLPLLYSELEIARTFREKDVDDLLKKLDYFEQQVKRFDVQTLNERKNSPVEYCELYRNRYLPRKENILALGAKVTYIDPLPERYAELGKTALTDGLFGGQIFGESWIGWEGKDASFIVDLGEEKAISSIETDFLQHLGSWILLPKSVTYSTSTDGEKYTKVGTVTMEEDREPKVKYIGIKHQLPAKQSVRYIRVDVEGTKICPQWHYGVGKTCWFFLDEVTVL